MKFPILIKDTVPHDRRIRSNRLWRILVEFSYAFADIEETPPPIIGDVKLIDHAGNGLNEFFKMLAQVATSCPFRSVARTLPPRSKPLSMIYPVNLLPDSLSQRYHLRAVASGPLRR